MPPPRMITFGFMGVATRELADGLRIMHGRCNYSNNSPSVPGAIWMDTTESRRETRAYFVLPFRSQKAADLFAARE